MPDMPAKNTDTELWREPPGDFYSNSVHITQKGELGINVGGTVFVMTLKQWHEAACALSRHGEPVEEIARVLVHEASGKFGWETAYRMATRLTGALPYLRGGAVAVKPLDDDQIMEIIKEVAPWRDEPKLNDLLTYEKSPPLFPQATYDVPSYRAEKFVRAVERRFHVAAPSPEPEEE